MQPILILQLLVLLTVANGIPVIALKLFGNIFAQPLDGGVIFLIADLFLGLRRQYAEFYFRPL